MATTMPAVIAVLFFFFQAEDGIRDLYVTGVQTCALPISRQRSTRGDANHLNAVLHRDLVERWRGVDAAVADEAPALLPGQPVLMLHNDYDRGLFNGDQGLVLRVSEGGAPHAMVVFPRVRAEGAGYVVYHLDS